MTLGGTEPEMSKAHSYDNRYLLPKNEAVQQIVLKPSWCFIPEKYPVRFPFSTLSFSLLEIVEIHIRTMHHCTLPTQCIWTPCESISDAIEVIAVIIFIYRDKSLNKYNPIY